MKQVVYGLAKTFEQDEKHRSFVHQAFKWFPVVSVTQVKNTHVHLSITSSRFTYFHLKNIA